MDELSVLLGKVKDNDDKEMLKLIPMILEILERESACPIEEGQTKSLQSLLISAMNSDNMDLNSKAVLMIDKWILKVCSNESILKTTFTDMCLRCQNNPNPSILEPVCNSLSHFVLHPPFKFSNEMWMFLIDNLDQFAQIECDEEHRYFLERLSLEIFLLSGLETPESLEKLKNRKMTPGWESFVGDLLGSSFSSNIFCRMNILSNSGVWTQKGQIPADFKALLLKTLLPEDKKTKLDVRRHCFYGLIRTLTDSRIGLFSFEIPIEALLGSFGDTIFPLEQVLTKDLPLVFRLFENGKIDKDSQWMTCFYGSIAKELGRKIPERIAAIITGIATLMVKTPEFCLKLASPIAGAIEAVTVPANWSLLCANLSAICHADSVIDQNKDKLLRLCFNKLLSEKSTIEAVYLSMLMGDADSFLQTLREAVAQKNASALHCLAFACYFSLDLGVKDILISILTDKSPTSSQTVLLAMIELMGISKSVRSQNDIVMYIHNYSVQTQSTPLLWNILRNLIKSPSRMQLDSTDLEEILPRQRDYFRFKSTIISSEFIDDDNAVVVCRNPYSMSAFRLSPVATDDAGQEKVEGEVPDDEDNPFIPYKPSLLPRRKRDTFFLLTSLGLFSAKNEFHVTPLSESYKSEIEEYEARAGRKRFEIAMTRLSPATKDIFEANTITTEFNTFTSKLGRFTTKYKCNGKSISNPVPYFDTVLFRFVYVSRMHVDMPVTETNFHNDIALLIFNETGASIAPSDAYSSWPVVISVSPVTTNYYSLQIVKWDCSAALPINHKFTRAVSGDRLSVEIAFMIYIYVATNVDSLYVRDMNAFLETSKLFSCDAPSDGLELLAQVFTVPCHNE